MVHYRMGSDSVPSRIDAIRGVLADDPDLAEVLGGREMRRSSRSVSGFTSSKVYQAASRKRPALLPRRPIDEEITMDEYGDNSLHQAALAASVDPNAKDDVGATPPSLGSPRWRYRSHRRIARRQCRPEREGRRWRYPAALGRPRGPRAGRCPARVTSTCSESAYRLISGPVEASARRGLSAKRPPMASSRSGTESLPIQ